MVKTVSQGGNRNDVERPILTVIVNKERMIEEEWDEAALLRSCFGAYITLNPNKKFMDGFAAVIGCTTKTLSKAMQISSEGRPKIGDDGWINIEKKLGPVHQAWYEVRKKLKAMQ